MPVSALCKQITIDICIYIFFMCVPILALFIWGQPATNGFWCNDQSLSFPYKPDTVSQNVLLLVGFGAPFFVMTVTELLRAALKTKVPRRFKREMFSLAKAYGVFLFGIATNVMFTDTIKYSVGRLRPHFFDLCKPDFGKINCTDSIARPPAARFPTDKLTSPALLIPCGNLSGYDALVVVHTKTTGFERRSEYRQTYGNHRFTWPRKLKVVFLLGRSKDPSVEDLIRKEHFLYRDTLQGRFIDAYVNLTYKAVMGFRWMSEMCYDVNVVIKMDDDVLVNVPRFFQEVWPPPMYLRDMIHCHTWVFAEVERTGKWGLDHREYKGLTFPSYCSGFFVVIPFFVTAELYRLARSTPFVWVDDAFIYGIVRDRSNLIQVVDNDHIAYENKEYQACLDNYGPRCKFSAILLNHTKPFMKSLYKFVAQSQKLQISSLMHAYVSDFECTNTEVDRELLKDGRLSFPSGHASLSMYSALFTVFYLQLRMKVSFSYLLRPVIQIFLVVVALLCCLTRIIDHKHFLTDVMAGTFLGVTIAWFTFYKLGHKVIPNTDPTQSPPPSHIRRATSIESEPQTPTPLLRPERLVLSHNHLQHNGGFRNGSNQPATKDQFGNV